MKQIILCSLIFLQCICYSQFTDDYLEGAEWRIFYTCEPEQNFFQDIELQLKVSEDTLIAGLVYNKVILGNQTNAQFFLRQDESKLFYRSSNSTTDSVEYEVYDFGLEPGQAFVYPFDFYQTQYPVSSVDSIELLDGSKRKRTTFSDLYNIGCAPIAEIKQWIEGIGGVPTPLYFYEDYCWCEFRGFNFSADGVLLYTSDVVIDDVDEIQEKSLEYQQTENQIEVLSDVPIEFLKIYDTSGRVMTEAKDSHNIQLSQLPSGIYILKVIYKNKVRSMIKFFK